MFDWDPDKARTNLAKHGVAFEAVDDFDFTSSIIRLDNRIDYGEPRWVAVGLIGRRLHILIFTEREAGFRIISLRRANSRERRNYEQAKA